MSNCKEHYCTSQDFLGVRADSLLRADTINPAFPESIRHAGSMWACPANGEINLKMNKVTNIQLSVNTEADVQFISIYPQVRTVLRPRLMENTGFN